MLATVHQGMISMQKHILPLTHLAAAKTRDLLCLTLGVARMGLDPDQTSTSKADICGEARAIGQIQEPCNLK